MKIHEEIDKWGISQKKKIAFIYGNNQLTYGELKTRTDTLSISLKEKYKKNEIFIIKTSNPLEGLISLLAASKADVKTILLDDSYSEKYIEKMMSSTVAYDEDEIFLGIVSSGSTSNPKLIWRTHASWLKAFPLQSKIFKINKDDIMFFSGALMYSANLNTALHLLYEGGTVIFASKKFPKTWIKEICNNKVTSIFMVPANYRMLLKASKNRINNVRVLLSAGEKMDKKTFTDLLQKFQDPYFFEYYGASELGHITFATKEDLLTKPLTVGKVFPNVSLDVINHKIWVATPFAAVGYEDKCTINDLGFQDDEGYLFLHGREGNVINKGGIKIIPSDVEKEILEIPDVEEVVVIGHKSNLKGEMVVSFIRKKENSTLSAFSINKYLKEKIPKGSIPQKSIFVQEFPMNKSGKIDYKCLKNMI